MSNTEKSNLATKTGVRVSTRGKGGIRAEWDERTFDAMDFVIISR